LKLLEFSNYKVQLYAFSIQVFDYYKVYVMEQTLLLIEILILCRMSVYMTYFMDLYMFFFLITDSVSRQSYG